MSVRLPTASGVHPSGPPSGDGLDPAALDGAPRPGAATGPAPSPAGGHLPHVVAWNLTRRCNLACAHCYISAGSWHGASDELDTPTALRVLDEVLEVNPRPVLILSGGEPLLREDLEVIAERASEGGATVVVGTNGTRLTETRIGSLMDAGVKGVAVSVDSLDPTYHDRFRNAAARSGSGGRLGASGEPGPGPSPTSGEGAGGAFHGPAGAGSLEATLAAVERCRSAGLDFIVQTTVTRGNRYELPDMMRWAADAGAVAFNTYFLVATGRGEGMAGMTPAENDDVLAELLDAEREYRGRMMVRSKCQPQIMRHALDAEGTSPLQTYATRCPCGVHYCRITPEGKVTPCPYTPAVAGDLLEQPFRRIWESSPVFGALRRAAGGEGLGGKCGDCRYRKVCGGCRARAYAESGDLLGPDLSCAYEPGGAPEDAVEPRAEVTYGQPADPELPWTDDARARLDRVPSFVRGVVTSRVEDFAREHGHARVDVSVMDEVRRSLPIDFSKRLPNFLKRGGEA